MKTKANNEFILNKGEKILVKFRRSLKAKNTYIRIISHKNEVELVIPKRGIIKEAEAFLFSKEEWVRSKLKEKKQIELVDQAIIPILGNNYQIIYTGKIRGITSIEGDCIRIYGLKEYVEQKVKVFLSKHLKREIENIALKVAVKLNVNFNKISIRETYSRWGSCSSSGNMSFAFRLVFIPIELVEYVVVHEVCHLLEMNHSKNFWQLVNSVLPDYQERRYKLKGKV